MSEPNDNALELIRRIQRKAPEYLDLLTATTGADFEAAFDAILGKAVSHLERNCVNFEGLNEVGLTAALSMAISIPGLTVIQEGHSNGHVDLTIVADHCLPERRKLGEAKIYDGPQSYVKGLKQLLDRYTTGRESRGLVVVYFQKQGIALLVQKTRQVLDAEKPCNQQGATSEHVLKWSFLSNHLLDTGDLFQVGHIGCNVCVDSAG